MNFALGRQISNLRARLTNNRTGKALSGLFVDYAGTSVIIVLSVVMTPIFLHLLSVPIFGFWVTVSQIILLLNLLDGGSSIYLIKGIAEARRKAEWNRLTSLISTTFWVYIILGGLLLVIGLSLSPFIANWLKVSKEETLTVTLAFRIAVLTASLSLISVPTFYGVLLGYQKLALASGIIYGTNILMLLVQFGLLYFFHVGVVAMAVGQLIATMLGAVLAILCAWRICPTLSLSPRHFRKTSLRQILGFTGYFQMSKVAFLASNYSDNVLIAGVYGTAAVTTYSLTQKLASTSATFMNKVGSMVMPGLAELYVAQDMERLQSVILRLTKLLTRFGFFCLLIIVVLNKRFVSVWVGADSFGGLALTTLFAYNVFRNGVIRNLAAIFFSSGQLAGWGLLSVVEATAKISLTLVLLPRLGLLAPVVATIFAELITTIYTPIRIVKLVGFPLGILLKQGILAPLLMSLPTALVLIGVSFLLPPSLGWLSIGSIALSGLLINSLVFDRSRWLDSLKYLKNGSKRA